MARRSVALAAALCALAAAPADATFPGRNGEILITKQHNSGSWAGEVQLVAIDPRTGTQRTVWECHSDPLTSTPECDNTTTPAVSTDGRSAALVTLEENCCAGTPRWQLNLVDLSTGTARSTDIGGGHRPPTDRRGRVLRWVPDGIGLTLTLYGPNYEPTFLNRRLSTDGVLGDLVGPPEATMFDWSIDGRAVFLRSPNLFVAKPRTSLWVLEPDGAQHRLIRNGTDPSWSPRGRWVAFIRDGQIWLVDSRGGRPRRLTTKGGERPAWSPDGRRIAFFRVRREEAFLYVLDLEGGPARRVLPDVLEYPSYGSSGGFITSPPEWQPLPR